MWNNHCHRATAELQLINIIIIIIIIIIKIIWYFVNFILTAEWAEDANWTHTHTHQWHNSWEKHQLLCIFIRNLRVLSRVVQNVLVRWSNSCFACILCELPSNTVCAHFCSRMYFWERSQNCQKRLLASSCLFVRPSVRMEQFSSHRTDYYEI
jgi:hypothetical protein